MVGDNWGWAAIIFPILAWIVLGVVSSFWVGMVVAGLLACVIAWILVEKRSTWFRREVEYTATTKQVPRQVTVNKQVAEHRCCIQCKHPIKVLR